MAVTKIKTTSSFTNLTKYDSFLAGNAAYNPSSYESIATTTVGAGGATDVTFSSIPSTYQHLQIRALAGNNNGSTGVGSFYVQLNADTGNNYSWHRVFGNGLNASVNATSSTSSIE